ncbi:MAG: PadR family transcriptional regulator [Minisyncoccales bacterium]
MRPIERLKKLNTIENLWLYILLILKDSPHYGWEMPRLIEERFAFKPGKITPYRVLYQLAFQGLVEGKIKERKKIYHLTNKGREELKKARIFYQGLLRRMKEI